MRLNKFLSGLAAVLLAFSLCNAASAAPLTKIRTAWMDSYETFAMWYAKEKGWDKEAGLDIDILFFDSGIVSGYNVIVIQLLCPLHQLLELHITVTVDTRIRGESVFIGADKAVHDLCAEIFRKIEHEIRNAQLTCNASCVLHVI